MNDLKYNPDEAVQRGVALLDRAVPGWYQRVDPNTIDMISGDNCVLGQVFAGHPVSGYYRGSSILLDMLPRMVQVPRNFGSTGDFAGLAYMLPKHFADKDVLMAWHGFWAPGDYSPAGANMLAGLRMRFEMRQHAKRWAAVIRDRVKHDHKMAELSNAHLTVV
jgi:hypothetical protein